MGFELVAKSLLRSAIPTALTPNDTEGKLNHLKQLSEAGFSPRRIFEDLRELADECGEDDRNVKLNIMKLAVQMHGMLTTEDQVKVAPTFILNVSGDNVRVNAMLCPALPVKSTEYAEAEIS